MTKEELKQHGLTDDEIKIFLEAWEIDYDHKDRKRSFFYCFVSSPK